MTDILNQIDATLAHASMERNARRFDLSAGGETAAGSTSACAMRWVPHGQDGIEEEAAPVEAAVDVTVIPADQFDELMAALDEPDDAPALRFLAERRRLTLADMEEASAAVRARRAAPPVEVDCCGHTTPGLLGTRLLFCTEPVGHEGDHRDDSGCSWSEVPPPAPWWRRMLGGGTR